MHALVDVGLTFAKLGFAIFFVLNFAGLVTWAERRQSAFIQDRIGCNRAYITLPLINKNITLFGLLFPAADGIKMILKEDFMPEGADPWVHRISPLIAWFPPFISMAFIPFGATVVLGGREIPMVASDHDLGLLLIFAFTSLGIFGVFLAGWASNNKWSLLGGLRAASQMISYEVTMGLTLIGVIMITQSLKLTDIVAFQNGGLWLVFLQPLAAILFLVACIAESKRPPFDVPEAESELVAGYFTEYSGLKFGMFFMAEFAQIIVIGALMTTIFFGGHALFPGVTDAMMQGWIAALVADGDVTATATQVVFLLTSVGIFTGKVIFFSMVQLQIRWTVPRFRYDQIMKLGWKMMLPASLLNLFVTGFIIAAFFSN